MKSKVLLVSLAAAVLAACGAANGAAPDRTVLGLTSTNYVTVTQTPTTLVPTTIAGAAGNPGAVHPEEGTYVIVAGDFPSTIANKFKVTARRPDRHQRLDARQRPGPRVQQPDGRRNDQASAELDRARHAVARHVTDTPTGTTPSDPTTTIAGGQSACAPGEYTIVEGDFLGKVAKKLDTTVEALNAANANTSGYASFYPGPEDQDPTEGRTASRLGCIASPRRVESLV